MHFHGVKLNKYTESMNTNNTSYRRGYSSVGGVDTKQCLAVNNFKKNTTKINDTYIYVRITYLITEKP